MFLVGLTGGIATGKSTVSKCLSEELKCPVVDADKIAREVVLPGCPAWKKIKEAFGDDILLENQEINREKLGQIIFSDAPKRKLLNSITHPAIYRNMLWKIFKFFITGHAFVVLDLPLLFETGNILPYLSYIIVVSCTEEQQMDRLMKRNNYTEEEARKRINAQMPLSKKLEKGTHIINNSADIWWTEKQVHDVYSELRQSYKHWFLRGVLLFACCSLFHVVKNIIFW